VEALRRTGTQLDTERLVDTLEAMHAYDLGLETTITFSRSEHQGSHKSWGAQLTETGKYELFELQ
jgi:hypothetical protein